MSKVSGYHTTEKGTKLPLISLKGKNYLQVAHRIVWFREMYPKGIIKTQMIQDQNDSATFRAEIFVPGDNDGMPIMVSTGHKSENSVAFPDYREKAETGAIGRALALMGIGTQFCEVELDEGTRLADSPIDSPKRDKPSFINGDL